MLFGRLATDGDKEHSARMVHFSDDLPHEYFSGLTSETFDPRTNRFIKKRGARNEPLDTICYSYAAAHHHELRLHLHTKTKWEELLAQYAIPLDAETRRAQPDTIPVKTAPVYAKPKRNSQLL